MSYKKYLGLMIFVLITFGAWSCAAPDSPSALVERFYRTAARGESEQAEQLFINGCGNVTGRRTDGKSPNHEWIEYIATGKSKLKKIVKETVEGTNADVTVETDYGGRSDRVVYDLRKISGEWKIFSYGREVLRDENGKRLCAGE